MASRLLVLYAYDIVADAPKTGDGANISGYWSMDGDTPGVLTGSAVELDAANMKGLYVWSLNDADLNAGGLLSVAFASSTENITVEPQGNWLPATSSGMTTRTKRFSMMNIGLPWRALTILPSGSITASDRMEFLGMYGGFAGGAYTSIGDSALEALESVAVGTITAPIFTAVGDSALEPLESAATGTIAAPVSTGVGDSILQPIESTAVGAIINPITGIGDSNFEALESDALGTIVGPPFVGIGDSVLEPIQSSASGTITSPVVIGIGDSTLEPLSSIASGEVTGVYTGVGASNLEALQSDARGIVVDFPPRTGIGYSTLQALQSVMPDSDVGNSPSKGKRVKYRTASAKPLTRRVEISAE